MPKTVSEDIPDIPPPEDVSPAAGQEGMSIEQMTAAQSPKPAAKPVKNGRWVGWLVLLLVAALIVLVGFFGRNYVVQIWPASAKLYQSLQINVETTNLLGLEIDNLTTKSVQQNGVTTLTVAGTIKNITESPQPLPRIGVSLLNDKDELVYSWTTTVEEREVQPWGQVEFSTSMNQPPEEAKNVKVDLIEIEN